MPLFPGLLVSCQKSHERSAGSEIFYTLTNEIGIDASKIKVRSTRISGLVSVKLSQDLDYLSIMRDLIALEENDSYFMHCLKIRPIMKVIPAEIDQLIEDLEGMVIPYSGSFRIVVNKRHTPLSSMDLIKPIASLFDNPVSLEHPEWEILIEIVADKLGYSIMPSGHIYSTRLSFQDQKKESPNWFLD